MHGEQLDSHREGILKIDKDVEHDWKEICKEFNDAWRFISSLPACRKGDDIYHLREFLEAMDFSNNWIKQLEIRVEQLEATCCCLEGNTQAAKVWANKLKLLLQKISLPIFFQLQEVNWRVFIGL